MDNTYVMAYIEKVVSRGKITYYLGKTIRLGQNKWKKLRIKLGQEKPTNDLVAQKLKDLHLEGYMIYNKDYIDAAALEIIDELKEAYVQQRKQLPKRVVEKEEADFLVRFTYNSNAIEGNRLTLRQTQLILLENQLPVGVQARDYNEAVNGKECLEYLKAHKGTLTIDFLCTLNKILTKNTGVQYPGVIRNFPVRIAGADFVPPAAEKVPLLLKKMIRFYKAQKNKLHPFVLASLLHAQFVEIHPFEDGNGRVGRTLMNWVLLKARYPLLYIPVRRLDLYYEAIDLHNAKQYKEYCAKMLALVIDQLGGRLSTN